LKEFSVTIDKNNKLKSIDVFYSYTMPKDTILNLILRKEDYLNYKRFKLIPPEKFGIMIEWSALSIENDTINPLKLMAYKYVGKFHKIKVKAKKGDVFNMKFHIEIASFEEDIIKKMKNIDKYNSCAIKEVLLKKTSFFDSINNKMLDYPIEIITQKLIICPIPSIK
jgi:hypothetical protein